MSFGQRRSGTTLLEGGATRLEQWWSGTVLLQTGAARFRQEGWRCALRFWHCASRDFHSVNLHYAVLLEVALRLCAVALRIEQKG